MIKENGSNGWIAYCDYANCSSYWFPRERPFSLRELLNALTDLGWLHGDENQLCFCDKCRHDVPFNVPDEVKPDRISAEDWNLFKRHLKDTAVGNSGLAENKKSGIPEMVASLRKAVYEQGCQIDGLMAAKKVLERKVIGMEEKWKKLSEAFMFLATLNHLPIKEKS